MNGAASTLLATLALLLVACTHARPIAKSEDQLRDIRGRIEAAQKSGNLAAVLDEYRGAPKSRGTDWYGLGVAEFAAGNELPAAEALRKALELAPDNEEFNYRLGLVLLNGEHFAQARGPLIRAAALQPALGHFRPALAVCLLRLGDRKAALDVLRDFAKLQFSPADALQAVKVSRDIADLYRDVQPAERADLERALGYLVQNAPGLALPKLEELVAQKPQLAAVHALLGLACARLDETGRAVVELHLAMELGPDLPQPHAWLAQLYSAKDKPDLAATELQAALARNPLDLDSLRALGELQISRTDKTALVPLQDLAALLPGDDTAQLLLARAELVAQKTNAAQERLESLAQRRPDDAEVLLRLALLLYDLRKTAPEAQRPAMTERVETLVKKVLALQPENAMANRLLTALKAG
jgi:tetratricopeptide (TPR) repeat protein